jgi:hypothetical protein
MLLFEAIGMDSQNISVNVIFWLLALIIFGEYLFLVWNRCLRKIEITDDAIIIRSFLKTRNIRWNEIVQIIKKIKEEKNNFNSNSTTANMFVDVFGMISDTLKRDPHVYLYYIKIKDKNKKVFLLDSQVKDSDRLIYLIKEKTGIPVDLM